MKIENLIVECLYFIIGIMAVMLPLVVMGFWTLAREIKTLRELFKKELNND